MRSARVRRAPAPPRCRRRRSSCLAPRFPRFASACPDFNFEISGDRNPEIYTRKPWGVVEAIFTTEENIFFPGPYTLLCSKTAFSWTPLSRCQATRSLKPVRLICAALWLTPSAARSPLRNS